MSEKISLKQTALLSISAILIPLLIEIYAFFIQQQIEISYFSLSVFAAQFLCTLVFLKGEICPGQRGRLINVQGFFAVFWLAELLMNFSASSIFSLAGLAMILLAYKQPKDDAAVRQKYLVANAIIGVVGVVAYFIALPSSPNWLVYSPFAQLLIGVILANIALVNARNRLQGFIALLPFLMAILLVLNVFFALALLASSQSAVHFSNDFAVILYFILHLILMALIAFHILRKIKLSYQSLMLILFIAASLPLWSILVNIT
ncbi:hypothetical protein A4G18_02125 [Pasteurellaceae bacterium Pebbles2]|nr:hypothetical protein [Pasteurellaceae bacterium Pebbles2]